VTAPTGVVLAGGASSRMRRDKALVEVDGRPMVLLVVDALRDAGCAPVWCQGGDPVGLGELGLDVHQDDDDGPAGSSGPVRAIATALRTVTAPMVVIAACDLPDLTGEVVRSLVTACSAAGTVAVAAAGGRRHLVAAWPIAAGPRVHDAITRGVVSYGDLLTELDAIEIAVMPELVRNVNRPDDVRGQTHDDQPEGWGGQRYPRSAMSVQEISVDELAPLLAAGARLVDVREPDEFEEARVPGGVLVPLATVPQRMDAFGGDGPTYLICRSGARSMRACEFLAEQGLDVVNVAGGTLAWIASGRDVVAGSA
jgi:molybdopterin-guanine dinucleotide biosynthesis protein A/rhodanese-related sulfurtransferase